jgi:hypothetical protein
MALSGEVGNSHPETSRTGVIPGSVRCLAAASQVIKIKKDKFNEYESKRINVRLRQ